MRLLTVLAVAALAAGIRHYRRHGRARLARQEKVHAAALAVPGVAQVTSLIETTEPLGDLGPMQSGIATGP
ncbi:MAG TPA: hypothetical protein VH600_15395 [Burkholderiales bacterium]|jgi:hypothetical protein